MEHKEMSFINTMRITWALIAALAIMVMVLNSRITNTQEILTFINDDSLHKIQEDMRVMNDNIVVTNENIEILQYNIYGKLNETCGGE